MLSTLLKDHQDLANQLNSFFAETLAGRHIADAKKEEARVETLCEELRVRRDSGLQELAKACGFESLKLLPNDNVRRAAFYLGIFLSNYMSVLNAGCSLVIHSLERAKRVKLAIDVSRQRIVWLVAEFAEVLEKEYGLREPWRAVGLSEEAVFRSGLAQLIMQREQERSG